MTNAATLPQSGTTPAGNEPGQSTPPATAPATGTQSEGQVTISTKEYAQLQRDQARYQSFQKRAAFTSKNQAQQTTGDPDDDTAKAIADANRRVQEAENRAAQVEIRGRVRDLLDKDEFKALPKSTRDLILKNPALLSSADSVDEALLDIEDFVKDQVIGLSLPAQQAQTQVQQKTDPKGHETPTAVSGGSPAPASAAGLENVDGLRGVALSRAVLRNSLRKAKGIQ